MDLKMQSGNQQQREKNKLASETIFSMKNAAIALEIELDRRDHEVFPTCSAHVAPSTLPSPPLDEVISLPDLQVDLLEGAKPHHAPSVLGSGCHPESGRTEEPSSSLAVEDIGDAHATRAKGRRSLPSDLPPSVLARIRLPSDLPPKRLKLVASAPCLGARLEDAAAMQEASLTA